jgi:hypothetical protein
LDWMIVALIPLRALREEAMADLSELGLGIGPHSGEAIVGNAVNIATRLQCIVSARVGQIGAPGCPSEVGNGLEIGRETFDKPHHFDVAMSFPFQLTAGSDAVEVAIEVELLEIARVIRSSSRFL